MKIGLSRNRKLHLLKNGHYACMKAVGIYRGFKMNIIYPLENFPFCKNCERIVAKKEAKG